MQSSRVRQEFIEGFTNAFRTLVPEPQDRIPISWKMLPYNTAAFMPFLFMAYLARRPDTHVIRILLLPTVIFSSISVAFRYAWIDPRLNAWNWAQCLFAEVVIAKALDYAFTKEGQLKFGETSLNTVTKPASPATGVPPNDHTYPTYKFIPSWYAEAMELICSMRGIGWEFGRGVYTPPENRPQQRDPFLWVTLLSFLKHYILLDLLESLIKLFPGVGVPQGASMYYAELPLVQRYAVAMLIHTLMGSALLNGFGMCYNLATLIGVGILHDPPYAWPLVMDNPWIADSMHIFWAKRWHQLLRRTFMVYGGIPGYWIGGNLGMVLGAFLASGLFHEVPIYAMGRGFDYRVPLFFTLQGPILLSERIWQRVTGLRVGGFFGRMWVYFCIFVLSQLLMDAWLVRGLGGVMVIPPVLSPIRQLLFPVLVHAHDIMNKYQISIFNISVSAYDDYI